MNGSLPAFYTKNRNIYAALILLPLLVYLKSLFYAFSPMDEQWLIVNDAINLEDWGALLRAFHDSIQKIYYRPVFMWSLIFDYHIGGLSPLAYHTSNLALHLTAVVLLYRLLLLLDTEKALAFLLTLLFSVHPTLLHAVAWIPGRNDVMLCIFTILSLSCFINYQRSGSPWYAAGHLLFFLLAMFTKETAMVLPLVYLFLGFKYGRLDVKKCILLALSLGGIALWFWLRNRVIGAPSVSSSDYAGSFLKFLIAMVIGTGKAILPLRQSVSPTIANSLPLVYACVVLLFFFIVFKTGLRNRFLAAFGLFTFFILLAAPVWYGILTTLGEQYEHRAYTPMIGLLIFAGQLNISLESRTVRSVLLALLLLFAGRSFLRMDVYKTPVIYLQEGLEDCPDNYIFQFQMGNHLYSNQHFAEALPYLNRAIAIQPKRAQLYNSRGNVYMELNKKDEAIADYTKAIELYPGSAELYIARLMTYKRFNDMQHAMSDLKFIQKNFPGTLPLQVEQEIREGWLNKRLSYLSSRIDKEPGSAILYVNRAKVYFDKGLGAEALGDLKKACELEPRNKEYQAFYDKLNATFPH